MLSKRISSGIAILCAGMLITILSFQNCGKGYSSKVAGEGATGKPGGNPTLEGSIFDPTEISPGLSYQFRGRLTDSSNPSLRVIFHVKFVSSAGSTLCESPASETDSGNWAHSCQLSPQLQSGLYSIILSGRHSDEAREILVAQRTVQLDIPTGSNPVQPASSLQAIPSTNSPTSLQWTASPTSGATYKIVVMKAGNIVSSQTGLTGTSVATASFSPTIPSDGSTYDWKVTAFVGAASSTEASGPAVTMGTAAMGSYPNPTGLSVNNGGVNPTALSFQYVAKNASEQTVRFTIRFSCKSGCSTDPASTFIDKEAGGTATVTISPTSFTSGASYSWSVQGVPMNQDASGVRTPSQLINSPARAAFLITTGAGGNGKAPTPTGLTYNSGANSGQLNWSLPPGYAIANHTFLVNIRVTVTKDGVTSTTSQSQTTNQSSITYAATEVGFYEFQVQTEAGSLYANASTPAVTSYTKWALPAPPPAPLNVFLAPVGTGVTAGQWKAEWTDLIPPPGTVALPSTIDTYQYDLRITGSSTALSSGVTASASFLTPVLAPAPSYTFKVRTLTYGSFSEPSAWLSKDFPVHPPSNNTAPNQPSIFGARLETRTGFLPGQWELQWNDVDGNENDAKYEVRVRKVEANGAESPVDGDIISTAERNWYHTSPLSSGNYKFQVQTKKYGSFSRDSGWSAFQTFRYWVAPAPKVSSLGFSRVDVTTNELQVGQWELKWENVGAQRYSVQIQRMILPSSGFTDYPGGETTNSGWFHTEVLPLGYYHFRVKAFKFGTFTDDSPYSGWSETFQQQILERDPIDTFQ